jgi:hypothetical protein
MLRKMYIIPPEQFEKCKEQPPRKQRSKTHSHDEWLKVKKQMQEDKVRNDVLIKSIGQFLQKVLPTTPTKAPVTEVDAVPPNK